MCCPSGAHGFLKSQGPTKGQVTDEYGVPCYTSGAGDNVVLLLPDVWGWNGGRIRVVADELAEKLGAKSVIPKILQPAFEEGTDGDGLPPAFALGDRMGDLVGQLKEHWKWEGKVGPVLTGLVEALSAKHKKIVLVGFCYGGWVAGYLSKSKSSIVGAAIAHPSAHLEGMLGFGETNDLFKDTTFPFAFYPAGNPEAGGDPAIYDAEGDLFKLVKAKFPESETHRYAEEAHGFVTRGSLPEGNTAVGSGEKNEAAIVDAVGRITAWLKARF